MNHTQRIVSSLACLFLAACDFSCAGKSTRSSTLALNFDENEAYSQILTYEKLGPSVPGTLASIKTGDWIVSELKKQNLNVLEQKFEGKTFDGHTIPVRNLMAQINPSASTRVLLSAHWDARPFSDQDVDPKFHKTPVPAVNDGGSGVVVLLGIAKALRANPIKIGVDLLFLDAEDWGHPTLEEGYCIGTKYWAAHPVPLNYQAKFGINYDMVGRIGAIFPIENFSYQRASVVIERLQKAAKELGYQDFFPTFKVGPIIDDHIYLMDGRGFPVADLIHMTPEGRFPPEWHTHLDNSAVISRDTLKVVGQTTLQVLSNENAL